MEAISSGESPLRQRPAAPTEALVIVALFGWFAAAPASAQHPAYSTGQGTAEFVSRVPFYRFTGRSDRLVGRISLADSTVDFYLDLETLKTGIGKRDKDLRRTLETNTYPFAEFYGRLVSPFFPDREGEQSAEVDGRFKMHGVEQAFTARGTIRFTEEGMRISAVWEMNLNDYAIKPPRLLVLKVDEVQAIRIEALLTPEVQ